MEKCKKEVNELEKHITTKIEGFLEERKEDNKIKIKAIKIVLKNKTSKTSKTSKTKQDLVKSASNNKLKTTLQYYYDKETKSLKSELKQLEKRVKKKTKK